MAKPTIVRPAGSPSLFDGPAALAPVPVPVDRVLTETEHNTVLLVTDCLRSDIARCESYLARPLSSWDERDEQIADVNASFVLAFQACAAFFPPDLRSLVNQFLDLRARLLLRTKGA